MTIRRVRVLAVGNRYPPAATGGYERIFAGTVAALEAAGHAVRVLTTPELEWYWRDGAFPSRSLLARMRLERRNAAILRTAVERFRPDVVSWWGMGGMSLALIEQVRRAGLPAVGVVADGWMAYGPRVAPPLPWQRVDLGAGARWLFISAAVRERALAEGHALPSTGLAHPGVDPAAFPFSPAGAWSWRLACIGRVDPRKGIAVAVQALAALPAEAALVVDGPVEGDHDAELRALAERLGVAGRVSFAGTDPGQVGGAYAAADVVLFPVTWAEPWGLVPLEAMSVGRPVVATGTGGSAEYLEAGVNALLTAPGDAAALAAAVRRLAGDGELRARLIEGGRATAARYSQAAFEARVVEALEQAAGA